MWDSKRQKILLSQSVEYSMHCVNYAKREQEKPLLFKLTLRSRSTLSQARSDTCHELLVVFGLSTLNSNRTNHKPRKKLANQKRRHMSLRLCGIRTRYCALIRTKLRLNTCCGRCSCLTSSGTESWFKETWTHQEHAIKITGLLIIRLIWIEK